MTTYSNSGLLLVSCVFAQRPVSAWNIFLNFGYLIIPKRRLASILSGMAMYKLNVLHFHFSEDEVWRMEIPGLPELTSAGVKRGHTLDSKINLPPTLVKPMELFSNNV